MKYRRNAAFLSLFLLVACFSMTGQEAGIVTFNIRFDNPNDAENAWPNRKKGMAAFFDYYRPAIFGLQEALYHQVEYLDSSLANYTYIGVGRDDGAKKGEYSPIFYDTTVFDVLKQGTFWLSEKPDSVSVGWDAALPRICTWGLFEHRKSGKKLWVFNTHFDHVGVKAREMSAHLLVQKTGEFNRENLPVILMGDLNCTPESPPADFLKSKFTDASLVSKKAFYGPRGTFNGFKTDAALEDRIDYIFVSGLAVTSYVHIDDKIQNKRWISDHLPVMATINLGAVK